jgi:hypothetical protein
VKRQSRSEVTLLVDLESDPISDKMELFILCPVEQNLVLSPRTRNILVWQKSMSFSGLLHAIDDGNDIHGICDICGTKSEFRGSQVVSYVCSVPGCVGHKDSQPVSADPIHPGSNRQYYGPVVPNTGRVWIGIVDKMSNRGRLGLLTATVYSLFHDSADVDRRGRVALKFPTPSPKIQWALFPCTN